MSRAFPHILVPLIATIAIVALYLTPVAVFGCATRGFMALGIAVVAMIASVAAMVIGARKRRRGDEGYAWWLVSSALLLLPTLLLVGPLG